MESTPWLSLMIGNSRLHWALLNGDEVLDAWDSSHLGAAAGGQERESAGEGDPTEHGIPTSFISPSALQTLRRHGSTLFSGNDASPCIRVDPRRFRVASVVPEELQRWVRRCPGIRPIASHEAIDGAEDYPTLGVDRALALRGGSRLRGWPVMVVDCGSALTFTACDRQGRLGGGAILPGVRLQLAALGARTAQLPSDVSLPAELPPRWAMSTVGGIQAGIMWTIVSGIKDFIRSRWEMEPDATVVFTGGDGQVLHKAVLDSWDAREPMLKQEQDQIKYVGEVIHWGIASTTPESMV